MSRTVLAVYEAGVFRPLQPVDLAQGTPVEVQVPSVLPQSAEDKISQEELAKPQAAIAKFRTRMAALPLEGPDDGFSGRDHDKVLYSQP